MMHDSAIQVGLRFLATDDRRLNAIMEVCGCSDLATREKLKVLVVIILMEIALLLLQFSGFVEVSALPCAQTFEDSRDFNVLPLDSLPTSSVFLGCPFSSFSSGRVTLSGRVALYSLADIG